MLLQSLHCTLVSLGDSQSTTAVADINTPLCAAFEAENDEEISVDAQQEVMVEAEVDGWYQVVRGSERGLVPASYVQVL